MGSRGFALDHQFQDIPMSPFLLFLFAAAAASAIGAVALVEIFFTIASGYMHVSSCIRKYQSMLCYYISMILAKAGRQQIYTRIDR